jgi:hypothetical protein
MRPAPSSRARAPRALRSALALATALGVLLAPLLAAAPARAEDRDGWLRRHAALDASIHGGRGYSESIDSATLAWAESYILASYLSAYRASGDTRYLDKVVEHGERIVAGASDPDGDGLRGWATYNYSASRVENGGFETSASAMPGWLSWLSPEDRRTLPAGWRRWQSDRTTAYRAAEGGGHVAVVKAAPGRGWQVLEAAVAPYTPGARYEVRLRARTDGGAAGGRLDVLDRTAGRQLAQVTFRDTAWRALSLRYTAPAAAGHEVLVRLHHERADVAGEARFDDVTVKRELPWLVHDGMITWPLAAFAAIARADATLDARYRRAGEGFVRFIEGHVLPRWEPLYRKIDPQRGTYVFPADADYGWRGNSLPHNQALALGRTFVHLHRAGGDPRHLARALEMGKAFLAKTWVEGDALLWRYSDRVLSSDTQDASGPEDTSHANIDVGFLLDMHEDGRLLDATGARRLLATFERKLWNGRYGGASLAKHVDGKGDDEYAPYVSEWARLADLEGSRARRVIEALYEERGWWAKAAAKHLPTSMAVAAHLARTAGLPNGGVEVAATADPTLPEGWRRWQSTAATALRDPAAAASGRAGITVRTDPARGWQVLERPLLDVPAATPAVLRFRGRTSGGAGGRVEVLDRTAGRVLASKDFDGAAWTSHALAFTTPPLAGRAVLVRVYQQRHAVAGGATHVDDLSLETSPLANGGFEAPERESLDPLSGRLTLPERWVRWQSSPATALLDPASAKTGASGATVRTDPARGWQVLEQRLASYPPGAEMVLSGWARADDPSAGARIVLHDYTAGRALATLETRDAGWRRLEARWRAPADPDHDIRVRLYPIRWDVAGAAARFDDIEVAPAAPPPP